MQQTARLLVCCFTALLAALVASVSSRAQMRTVRHVWTGPPPADLDDTWAVSPDGEWLAFRDAQSHLAWYRFASRESRQLPEELPASQDRTRMIWSLDGARIAYNRNASAGGVELRVLTPAEGTVRVVAERTSYVAPLAWSPDGNRILVGFEHGTIDELQWIDLSDGRTQKLKQLQSAHRNEWQSKAILSRDGQRIAFVRVQPDGRNRDVFTVDADGRNEAALVEHPADDYPIAWTSANELLFASDRAGQTDLWLLPMVGATKGIVKRVHRDLGMVRPLGMTAAGALYYAVNLSMTDVYTVALNAEMAHPIGVPAPVARSFVGNNSAPDLSPDGTKIVYQVGLPGTGLDLVLESLASGDESVIHPMLQQFSRPRFDPLGNEVAVHGIGHDGTQGVFSVDLTTGKASLLFASPPSEFVNPSWTRDGARLYFERDNRAVWMLDRNTGKAAEVFAERGPAANFTSAPSPDGAQVAVVHGGSLDLVDVASGARRELLRAQAHERLHEFPGSLAWMPDGRHILFGKVRGDTRSLWRVSPRGGNAEPLGIEADTSNLYFLRVSADGKRLAFVMGDYDVRPLEVWVLENVVK